MPERLQYDDKSKFKLIQKKRTAFRKQAKENYQIIENRLNHKYKLGKNNYKFLNIPLIFYFLIFIIITTTRYK